MNQTQKLARELGLLYRAYRRMKGVADRLEERYKTKRQEFFDHCEATDTESITVSGAKYTPYTKSRAYVDNPEEFIEWAKDNDPSLIQVVERKQLLTNEVRRRIDDGEAPPPGVKWVATPSISITKS